MTKNSGLRIRVERELREKFLELCRKRDRPAAQVLRDFMREYIEANAETKVPGRRPVKKSARRGL